MPTPSDLEAACNAAKRLAQWTRSLRMYDSPAPPVIGYECATRILAEYDWLLQECKPAIDRAQNILPKISVEFAGKWAVNLPAAVLKLAQSIREALGDAIVEAHLLDYCAKNPRGSYEPPVRCVPEPPGEPDEDGIVEEKRPRLEWPSLADMWTERTWDTLRTVFAGVHAFELGRLAADLDCLTPCKDEKVKQGGAAGERELPDNQWEVIIPGRLCINRATATAELDGNPVCVRHAPAFSIFVKVAEAKGSYVETQELEKLPGCKGRIDRILTNLPQELRDIIPSRRGQHGGYSLRLPELLK